VYIPPPTYTTAASFVPSELDAIPFQFKDADADVSVQIWRVVPVALHPSPDLSLHVVIIVPLSAGTPVAFGSAASSHTDSPGTVYGAFMEYAAGWVWVLLGIPFSYSMSEYVSTGGVDCTP
jgi:hypothetical protein